ncbi:hypothetical protein BGX33_003268, partial [Mortierella sp. NVP41]
MTERSAPLDSDLAAAPAISSASEQSTHLYPEGGYGWIVLAATFVSTFWCIGIVFCWGVFQEYLLRMNTFPGMGAKELSWVGSLSCACIFVAAPAIVVLIKKLGTNTVLALGVLCVTTGFVAASFATQYWHLYITIGFLYGFGGCLMYFTCINVLARYFNKRRGVVVGVAISGSGIGSSVMAPLLHHMLYTIGFPWTMRIMGVCMFVCLAAAACFIRPYRPPPGSGLPVRSSVQELPALDNEESGHTTRHMDDRIHEKAEEENQPRSASESPLPSLPLPPSTPSPTTATVSRSLDFTLFWSPRYTLIFIGTNLFALVYLVPILLTPIYATSIGLAPSSGALMITIVSSVGIVSRIVIGYLAERYGALNATI